MNQEAGPLIDPDRVVFAFAKYMQQEGVRVARTEYQDSLQNKCATDAFRRDMSNQPYFDRGNELASSKNMNTLLAGFVVYFGPTR